MKLCEVWDPKLLVIIRIGDGDPHRFNALYRRRKVIYSFRCYQKQALDEGLELIGLVTHSSATVSVNSQKKSISFFCLKSCRHSLIECISDFFYQFLVNKTIHFVFFCLKKCRYLLIRCMKDFSPRFFFHSFLCYSFCSLTKQFNLPFFQVVGTR